MTHRFYRGGFTVLFQPVGGEPVHITDSLRAGDMIKPGMVGVLRTEQGDYPFRVTGKTERDDGVVLPFTIGGAQ